MRETDHLDLSVVVPMYDEEDVLPSRPVVRARRLGLRLLPWLFPLLVSVICLLSIDVPLGAIVRYAVYFSVCVVLPGVLVMRALWRTTGNWAEDVGLGAAVGIAFQLAGWALFTALGWQRWSGRVAGARDRGVRGWCRVCAGIGASPSLSLCRWPGHGACRSV